MDVEHGQPVEIGWQEHYDRYKGLLFGIAYRMTGSVADAEDLVQDVFLQLKDVPPGSVRSMKAYLCRMVTHKALDLLKSARRRRELYVGPWLPEPLADGAAGDPGDGLARKETVAYAVLTLMERLNPVERAVFVLREAFGFDYPDIAGILGKSEAGCRKVLSRVKPKLQPDLPEAEAAPDGAAAAFTEAFLTASATGRLDGFVRLLAQEAVLYSDGGGKVRSAVRPIYGAQRVLAFFAGLHRKSAAWGLSVSILPASFNGQEGLELRVGSQLYGVMAFRTRNGRVTEIYLQRNPDKLARFPTGRPRA